MNDLDREYLLQQFRIAEEFLVRARRLAERSREEYLADAYGIDASIRELTVLFETCHNVAKHLVIRQAWRTPASKAETFEVLTENGVLPPELSDAFREASRFRNLVTYQTAVVQDDLVYEILQGHLEDFELFLSHVARWLADRT